MNILVLGAGGLGCEIIKNLYMINKNSSIKKNQKCKNAYLIKQITLIDFDKIELTNLNRQFLFKLNDIGEYKSIVIAKYFNQFIPTFITPLIIDIKTLDYQFLEQFDFIISGLDSIDTRRYINNLLINFTRLNNYAKIIPFIDSACEGFKGHIKLIIPTITACWECTIDTLPSTNSSDDSAPLCTLASRPRNLIHIIQYVWLQQSNLNKGSPKIKQNQNQIDNDDEEDETLPIETLLKLCKARAKEFQIDDSILSPSYIEGIIKKTIPSTAPSNAMVASQACSLLLRLYHDRLDLESIDNLDTFTICNLTNGVYFYKFAAQRSSNCPVCSGIWKNYIYIYIYNYYCILFSHFGFLYPSAFS
ncbi:hypothetical protein TBLA_0H01590 [Henningerozyma blattae CBS 6284]|uniref:NEDD8-activating enzyme E1 catalytic subunit n=1 Tax=Henningerozyma blattae (strain ATCC 34711 / CBS 6284 / DSM 70876 / NBRC 10599 / NRRL Y-10934 / UCD 77-7) TaxID=1071380 RepID=I2H7U4_HENB6|nr:hypothetical protein TBLA_0H01590 [Tetrapisispora blattae CBS 6284]CCH62446.1 hypothetical protein TBLA_0H01590 [Tetrapisispora blattae CBS 6284]